MLHHTSPGFANKLRRGTHLKHLLIIVALTVATAACDSGSPGPAGPAGPAGPEGPQGPQGEDGTANVIYSDWVPIDWNGLDDSDFKRMDIDEPRALEADVMEHGTTLVYLKEESTGGVLVLALPAVIDNSSLYYGLADVSSGSTTIQGIAVVNRSIDTNPVDDFAGYEVRYVLIPGGAEVPALRAGLRTDLDLSDYDAVTAYYGIPDEGVGQIPFSR